jgi:large subunit ribosomal protein L5
MKLQEKYKKEILSALKEKFGYTNNLAVPGITKVTVNIGGGKFVKDSGFIEAAEEALKKITGQSPVKTKAKKSISSFKIRQGMVIGLKVTLRRSRMYDFLEKLVNVALPRVRDFRGLAATAVDNQGNFNIGFSEHMAFPEVSPDDIDKIHGLEVCVTTTARTKEEGFELLRLCGFPFKQTEEKNK